MAKKRVLSGMRPTGRLHLGHLHGVLSNWLRLQKEYECFFFAADWHALTTDYSDTASIRDNTREMVLDWLSVGIDPEASTIFLQSRILEHAELFVLLSMITPMPWLERNPTYKDLILELQEKDLNTFGFLGYPVLQTADIIAYKAELVPVGIDQAPHLELSREITRRFNFLYGRVFPEPETLLTEASKVLGTDGRKMSKSYDNAIFLSDGPKEIEQKMLRMVTDTARMRKTDPGNADLCPFFLTFHSIYSSGDTMKWAREGCANASIGCIECKRTVIPKVLDAMAPIQEKRKELEKDPDAAFKILDAGSARAAKTARETMREARKAMGVG